MCRVHRPIGAAFVACLAAALIATLATFIAPPAARATQITVTTTADEHNTDGDCSLREAIRAANANAARDACPAGEAAATDTVVLQGGATYVLTRAGTENAALSGDLDLLNGPAALDLVIRTDDGELATIVQDADPDDRVLDVVSGASVVLEDLVIRGGTAPGSTGGGGIAVGTGTSVVVRRSTLEGNAAGGAGGAIAHLGAALTLEDTLVRDNVAATSGGALRIGPSSSASISGTLFENNVAAGGNGGAIASEGTLDVQASSFVANRAKGRGGAVASLATVPGATTLDASCLVGNEDAVANLQSATQDASGCWWGSADGPSGDGPGNGDAVSPDVTFAGFLTAPSAACLPLELVANGGFESNREDLALPDRWRIRRLSLPDEGRFCDQHGCAVEIDGGPARTQVLQTIQLAGQAGDRFTLRARSSAQEVPPTGGKYLVELRIVHADGSAQTRVLKFAAGSHGFEERTKDAVASEPYVRLKVRLEYSRPTGSVRFDDVSVVREP